MALVALVSFVTGIVFWIAGAWPVFFFFGLDVALIYIAFRLNYASARVWEDIEITAEKVTVSHCRANGKVTTWSFQPYWVRVELEERELDCGPLRLRSHGRVLEIASFLSSEERREFADMLRNALADHR